MAQGPIGLGPMDPGTLAYSPGALRALQGWGPRGHYVAAGLTALLPLGKAQWGYISFVLLCPNSVADEKRNES